MYNEAENNDKRHKIFKYSCLKDSYLLFDSPAGCRTSITIASQRDTKIIEAKNKIGFQRCGLCDSLKNPALTQSEKILNIIRKRNRFVEILIWKTYTLLGSLTNYQPVLSLYFTG